jgi:hypothetical protein
MMRGWWQYLVGPAALLALAGCHTPKPAEILDVSLTDAHWAVDTNVGETHYLAPVVRFRVHNKSGEPQGSIQATATFRRVGEENITWGSDFRQVAARKEPLAPSQDVPVMLKSDARYYSTGDPSLMFGHGQWKDAKVEVYLRVGSSGWVKFLDAPVERRIGTRSVQEPPAPAPQGTP